MKLSSLVALPSAVSAAISANQTVWTSSGRVSGHLSSVNSTIDEYLNIPYAQPPVGSRRFSPPVPYFSTSTVNGDNFGSPCPGAFAPPPPSGPPPASLGLTPAGLELLSRMGSAAPPAEDCLSLNVWAPRRQRWEQLKPVLVWIHGGGFVSGDSNNPYYAGAFLAAEQDVVVVNFNYRLGAFGFPGSLVSRNNLGLLDQRLALEWVRRNIDAFGGDTAKITVFGNSAGAFSVDYYSYAWTADPIVAGLISQSGSVFAPGLQATPAASATAWFTLSSTLGCGNSSSDPHAVLTCMRTKPMADVVNNTPNIGLNPGGFGPTIDNLVVFSDYASRLPMNRPLLTGSNDNEAELFKVQAALGGFTAPQALWDNTTQFTFNCPAAKRAAVHAAAGRKTWRYRYVGDFPNLRLTTMGGASHGAEVSLLFRTQPASISDTPAEASIGAYMRGAWAAFARDPQDGLSSYGWPIYNSSGSTLVRLGYNNVTGANLAGLSLYDAGCPL